LKEEGMEKNILNDVSKFCACRMSDNSFFAVELREFALPLRERSCVWRNYKLLIFLYEQLYWQQSEIEF
jgi:hypothetical protein